MKPPHPLPASIPTWLQAVVTKAMAKEPTARFQTATEMLSALQPSVPPSPVVSLKPKHSRRVWLGASGIVLLFPFIWAAIRQMGDATVNVAPTPTATVAKPLALTPKPKLIVTVPVKPSSTPTTIATPKPLPKAVPTLFPTPLVPPRKRPTPAERGVPRVVVPDKPKPTPRPKKQDPDCIFTGRCK